MEEVPEFKEMAKHLKPLGLEIVGISVDGDKEAAETGRRSSQDGIWTQLWEKSEEEGISAPLAYKWGIFQVPYKLLIDKDGKLVTSNFSHEESGPWQIIAPARSRGQETPGEGRQGKGGKTEGQADGGPRPPPAKTETKTDVTTDAAKAGK